MHRLFVAIRPPTAVRARLLDIMHGISGVRWLNDDQLHLTLKFIGEVDRHKAQDVVATLGSIHHPSFRIALNGIGSFDRRGKAALWVGVTPQGELKELHKKIEQACRRVGIDPEGRAFLPHITIARLGRTSGSIEAFIGSVGGLTSPPFEVDNFMLYESDLTPDGAVYSIVERYPLDRPFNSP